MLINILYMKYMLDILYYEMSHFTRL